MRTVPSSSPTERCGTDKAARSPADTRATRHEGERAAPGLYGTAFAATLLQRKRGASVVPPQERPWGSVLKGGLIACGPRASMPK